MGFQDDPDCICWKLHLHAPAQRVHQMLSTNEGRARFWAESTIEAGDYIDFKFPNGQTWRAKILVNQPPRKYVIAYFGGSITSFELSEDASGGTDLTLTDVGVPLVDRAEVIAGWVSVLLALKATVDFSVDLRNHDPLRSWDDGFVDN